MNSKLEIRKKRGNLRKLQFSKALIDFASGDYLGLARSPALIASFQRKIQDLPKIGSTGSRLLTGNTYHHEKLEHEIASFHGFEAGLLFGCGYMANVGLLQALVDSHDRILFDSHSHASTRDGIRLSHASSFPFRHNDLNHLEYRLKNSGFKNTFICIESVYSTDGSIAPIQEIQNLANHYNAKLIVDEAHATGVIGPAGRGLVAKYDLNDQVFAQITTFGKALGTYGAIVLGNKLLKQTLLNFAHACIYTTAPPLPALTAIKCSYALFPHLDAERKHLQNLIQIFRHTFPLASDAHIQSVPIKGNDAVKQAAARLALKGFDVRPLMSPTVQQGKESLRICLHAFNSQEELKDLIVELKI